MAAQRRSDWIDRAIAWLSTVLLGPTPVTREVRVERDPDPRELARRGIYPPRRL